MSRIQAALTDHARCHPKMEPRDVFKFIYQAVFGCEHMITDPKQVTERIREEEAGLAPGEREIESLGEHYSRVPLGQWDADALGRLFYRSAKGPKGTVEQLETELEAATRAVQKGQFPFGVAKFEADLAEWKRAGYPAIRHSEEFRAAYHPAYRVIENRFLPFFPLLEWLEQALKKGPLTLAIEGGSASGKSTLGALLEELYGCALFHMDDFFLRPEQRTPARFAEPGGNVDRERFLKEVLIPLKKGGPVTYRPFDCTTGDLAPAVTVLPKELSVIEGVYSLHPELAEHYDYSVFLKIDSALQRARIQKRNSPKMAERFFKEWIPLEQLYFERLKPEKRCDLVIEI